MLGNRGASLTTESSAAFPLAEDASPDKPHSKPKHSGGTTLTHKEVVSLLGTRHLIKAYEYRLHEFTTPRPASVYR